MLDPRQIQTYSTKNQYMFKHMFDLIGIAYVLRVRDSQNVIKNLISESSKIPQFQIVFCYEYPVERRILFGSEK